MPKCYQLVGVPGSGKSTWIKEQPWARGIPVASTDWYIDSYACDTGKTYSEAFKEYMPIAVRLMANHVASCRTNGSDIIWDQTSTTVQSRHRKFTMLPDYEHIAVVFMTHQDADELGRRLQSRPGKEIPEEVMIDMINNFQVPTEDEGFKEIWFC